MIKEAEVGPFLNKATSKCSLLTPLASSRFKAADKCNNFHVKIDLFLHLR